VNARQGCYAEISSTCTFQGNPQAVLLYCKQLVGTVALTGLLLLLEASLQRPAAAQTCSAPVSTSCPTALAAAQVLTGNSSLLPIGNPSFSTPSGCTGSNVGLLTIRLFGGSGSNPCHYMRQFMPSGALGCNHSCTSVIGLPAYSSSSCIQRDQDHSLSHAAQHLHVWQHLTVCLPACLAGAVVLSKGNGIHAVATSNINNSMSTQQLAASRTDAELAALSSAMGYNQQLFGINILSFDITPAVSGPITFSYVFGSDEYQEFSPTSGEDTS
jgi:hypothetical protein